MKTYSPQPGTIPYHAIEHLKTLPAGTELSSAAVADAIGQPRGIISACLDSPRAHGAVKSRKVNGVMYWSLGDGTPTPPPADHVPDEPLHPAPKAPKPASLFDLREPRPMKPRATPAPARQAEPETGIALPIVRVAPVEQRAPTTDRAKFGVYSDGTFCVQRGTDAIWLTASETTELAEFIAKNHTQ